MNIAQKEKKSNNKARDLNMLKKRENKIPEISSSEMNHPGDQTESGKINICERGGPYIV